MNEFETTDEYQILIRKINYYKDKGVDVHIDLKGTTTDASGAIYNKFYNGKIIDIGTDFLIIFDRKIRDTFVLFREIDSIEQFTSRIKDDDVKTYPANCSICSKGCMVPFVPIPGKPIYCKSCYATKRGFV